jgi:hypothetical protein
VIKLIDYFKKQSGVINGRTKTGNSAKYKGFGPVY